MNLSEILKEECICINVRSRSKTALLRELASIAADNNLVADREKLFVALLARERIQTTGIGYGMAIPHATAEGVKGLVLVLGISRAGIDYDALDNQPVHLIFMLAGEPRLQTSFLSILSKISRFFRKGSFRDEVLKAENPAEILTLIRAREEA